jgi:hypothetical protein
MHIRFRLCQTLFQLTCRQYYNFSEVAGARDSKIILIVLKTGLKKEQSIHFFRVWHSSQIVLFSEIPYYFLQISILPLFFYPMDGNGFTKAFCSWNAVSSILITSVKEQEERILVFLWNKGCGSYPVIFIQKNTEATGTYTLYSMKQVCVTCAPTPTKHGCAISHQREFRHFPSKMVCASSHQAMVEGCAISSHR